MIHKDIIYGNIQLSGIYEEIVNCDDFVRLKDITQTGMATIKYKELEQETRYEHSIGVYHLMCRTLNNLERKLAVYGLRISKEERELAKMAALLHDIGHGVHSHLLEKITGVSHELRGIDIIKDKDTQIHKIISQNYGEEFVNKLAEFMNCIYGNGEIDESIALQENSIAPLKLLLASLVSHNIDLDRIDYLVRESTYTEMGVLCNYEDLINSFECVLAGSQIVLAIPIEKMHLIETSIFERGRNYDKIYYCEEDSIGDHAFKQLLNELRKHPEEVPDTVPESLRKFLTQEKADLTNIEYMQLTNSTLDQAVSDILANTKNEKVRYLCNYKANAKRDYQVLYNSRSKSYIKKLLKKVIPGFKGDTACIFSDTKTIKPYKKTKFGSTNIITKEGIQSFEDLQHFVSIKPVTRTMIAINPEILRLELGISQQEYDEKYREIVQEIISNQAKPKQEFELKYVLTDEDIHAGDIIDLLEENYEICDGATYVSTDTYYDSIESFYLLESGSALRTREGHISYKGKESGEYKSKRITFKSYAEDGDTTYTNRSKVEEIGDSVDLNDYPEFLNAIGVEEELIPTLDVNNFRRLFTIEANGQLIDVSFNVSSYQNCIYEMPGTIRVIEIRPRDNKTLGRVLLLEIKQKLEEAFPELAKVVSNANVYEIGMVDSYEKYKNGYIISEEAQEFEKQNPESSKKLEEIIEMVKQKRKLGFIDNIIPANEFAKKNETKFPEAPDEPYGK